MLAAGTGKEGVVGEDHSRALEGGTVAAAKGSC